MHKYFAATDTTAIINFSNNFYVGYSDSEETQEISAIDFLSGRYGREIPYRAQSQVLGQVGPIVYSETIADLEAVSQG